MQMRIPGLTSGANSWDYRGKVLPEQADWILDVGLSPLLGVKCSPGHCSPPPSHPLSADAPEPAFQETWSTTLPLDFILCPTRCLESLE